MPMMRRGPLDRYPADGVLREAEVQRIDGSIEFHGDGTATFYLDAGRIYAADDGTGMPPPYDSADDEAARRADAEALLREALRWRTGWYYHDPLGHLPDAGAWSWAPSELIVAAQTGGRGDVALPTAIDAPEPVSSLPPPPPSAGDQRLVALLVGGDGPVTLSADAWAAITALATPTTAAVLAGRLGWDPGRVGGVLDELVELGRASRTEPDVEADDPQVLPFRAPVSRGGALRRRRSGGPASDAP